MTIASRRRALMGQAKADPYTWEELFKAIDRGTYASNYALGDLIRLDLGTGGVLNMQIVAFDADIIADSNNAVPVTLISHELFKTNHRYNPAYVAGTIGTGTIGGFENSELRGYLVNTVYPLIPDFIRQRLVIVKKYTQSYDVNDTKQKNTLSNEKIWIPSMRELGNTSCETLGPIYNAWFNSNAKRKKGKAGASTTEYKTRSAYSTTSNYDASSSGSLDQTSKASSTLYPFPIGFCIGGT